MDDADSIWPALQAELEDFVLLLNPAHSLSSQFDFTTIDDFINRLDLEEEGEPHPPLLTRTFGDTQHTLRSQEVGNVVDLGMF